MNDVQTLVAGGTNLSGTLVQVVDPGLPSGYVAKLLRVEYLWQDVSGATASGIAILVPGVDQAAVDIDALSLRRDVMSVGHAAFSINGGSGRASWLSVDRDDIERFDFRLATTFTVMMDTTAAMDLTVRIRYKRLKASQGVINGILAWQGRTVNE